MIGQKFAHYEIVAKIGSGGMGDVYKARDTKLDRDVALKVLPEAMARDPERRMRFEREAKAVAALKHPNIVTIYSVEEEKGSLYLTMELVEGKSLDELTPKDGMSLQHFFDIAIPLADAIGSAHAVGIAHRDLKPANIMLDAAGRVKVLDFGLAKLFLADPDNDKTVAADSDTQPGMVMGTVSYMSPEQAEGKSVDHRSDVFSLGILLYEMATGERPFRGDTNLSIMSSILRDEPVSITEVKRTLPNQLGRILDHCLAKDPGRRFQAATDIRNELEALKAEVGSDTARYRAVSLPSSRPRGKRAGAVIAVAAVVAMAIIFGPNLFKGGTDGGAPSVQTAEASGSLAIFPFDNLKDPSDPDRIGQIMQELLITDLSGLDAVQVFSSQRLQDIQKQIGGDGQSSRELAGAVAERAGARTMLTGSLSQLGEKWILTCQLVDVDNGTIVQSKRIDGDDLYTMVDQLTREFHADLAVGEPAELDNKIPIAQKTSASLEAFKHLLAGADYLDNNDFDSAVASLDAAIEIDPKFGQAYYKRAIAKWWRDNEPGTGTPDVEYLLTNKLYASEKERRMAEAMIPILDYQWSEALPLTEQLTRDYPDEKEAWYALGEALFHFPGGGKRQDSTAAFERAVALDPDFELPYRHILDLLWWQKRREEALVLIERRVAKDPENIQWHRYRAGFTINLRSATEAEGAIADALAACKSDPDRVQTYLYVSSGYSGIGNLEQTEVYQRMAVALDPTSRDATRSLYYTLVRQAKFAEAEVLARAESERHPNSFDAAQQLMNSLRIARRFDEGRKLAEEALGESDDTRWHDERVRFAIWGGKDEVATAAIAEAENTITTTDDRRRFFEEIAESYVSVGQLNKGLEYYEKSRETDPDNEYPDMFAEIGFVYQRQGRHDEAEAWFRRTLIADPNNIDAIFGMSTVARQRGEQSAASEYFQKGIETVPVEWVGPYGRASDLILRGDLEGARRELQIALADRTSEAIKWDSLDDDWSPGWVFLHNGYFDDALEVFTKMSEFDMAKRDPGAHIGLGFTYLCRGDADKAERAFADGLKTGVVDGSLLTGLALASYDQGDLPAAEEYARRVFAEDRSSAECARALGYIEAAQGNLEEAVSIAQQVVADDSTRASLELLAWLQVSGDIDVAGGIETANRAMAIPRSKTRDLQKYVAMPAPAEHTLGLAYLKQGDPKKAVEYLELAVAYQPVRELAKEDLERAREAASGQP